MYVGTVPHFHTMLKETTYEEKSLVSVDEVRQGRGLSTHRITVITSLSLSSTNGFILYFFIKIKVWNKE